MLLYASPPAAFLPYDLTPGEVPKRIAEGEAVRRAIIFGGLFCAFMNAAEAGCSAAGGPNTWGVENRLNFYSDGGSGCRLPLQYAGATGEIHSFKMMTPPKHGKASVSGLTIYYIPRSGYKGEDEFVFGIIGRLNGQPQRATMRVTVAVR